MKNLNEMKREDIFNTELIGVGIPDLQDEIDKLQNESSHETSDSGFGFGGSDNSDIFGFGSPRKEQEDSEED